ncbi:MAG: transglutaminaseTgpA domain-containing protein [Phycisphaerales bacterium JB040]
MILRRADNLTLTAAMLGVLTYLAASADAVAMLPVIVGILGARFVTGPVDSGRSLPGELITLAVLAVMSIIAAVAFTTGFDIELFARLIALLLTLKCFERRGPRDLSQILVLTVFLLIGALLSDSRLLVGLGLLVMIPLTTSSAIAIQLAKAAGPTSTPNPPVPGHALSALRRTTALVVAMAIAGAVGVFLVMPRGLAERAFGDWGEVSVGNNTVGFDDEINLDVGGLISDSQTPVLDLQVVHSDGRQLGALGEHYYLRGAVLDVYEDRRWTSSESFRDIDTDRIVAGQYRSYLSNTRSVPRDWTIEQRIIVRNAEPNRTYVFASWEPLLIRFDQTTSLRIRDDVGAARFESTGGKLSYTVRVRDALDEGDLNDTEDRFSTIPPAGFPSEAVEAFATGLLTDAGHELDPALRDIEEDRRIARLFENHLQSRFEYTLAPTAPPPDADPIEWFLTEERRGHCEFFASAMAAMCRSVGIHARVVTGYVATEYNDLTGYYTVRESNAHAWVEVQVLPGRTDGFRVRDAGVWMTYDPTPPQELRNIHEPKTDWVTRAKQLFETAEFAWINSIVGFGSDSQRTIIGTVRLPRFFNAQVTLAEDRIRSGGRRVILIAFAAGLGAFVGSLFLLAVIARVLRGFSIRLALPRLGRRRGRAGMGSADLDRAYETVLTLLRKVGVPKPAGVPLRRHIQSERATLGERHAALLRVAESLYLARFSRAGLSPQEHRDLLRRVREASRRPG